MKTKLITLFILLACCSCRKLVEIPQPTSTITDVKVFNSDGGATSAVVGIYNNMVQPYPIYSNGGITVFAGMSSDELSDLSGFSPFYTNTLLPNQGEIINFIWPQAYYHIYQANAVIEGLQKSTGVSPALKTELTGEAKFVRAFVHFYLVNLFGDIPLVTQSSWSKINLLPRTPAADVYQQIVLDLKDAQAALPKDYPASTGGEKIRPNYWAATALLARVYLYLGRWQDAYDQSSALINSGTYSLVSLDQVFLKNSGEAIFQLQTPNAYYYATGEGNTILPFSPGQPPSYKMTNSLFSSFEPGDQRKVNWTNTVAAFGNTYNYPYKYKAYRGTPGNITEYYMVLRLAEQYLIKAEAEANGATGGDAAALADLNIVRARASLPSLSSSLTHDEVIAAVAQERRVELFAEWGHRWFDLKRTGKADAVLAPIKLTYKPFAKLWPIPQSEIILDPNLSQNPGYN